MGRSALLNAVGYRRRVLTATPVVIDASSPAAVTSNTAVASLTTAAFIPPAGAVLLMMAIFDTATSTRTGTPTTVTGSTSAWTTVGNFNNGNGTTGGLVHISWARVTTATSTTVRVTWPASSDCALKVWVLTGAPASGSPIGASGSVTLSTNPQTVSYAATGVGSQGFIGLEDFSLAGAKTISNTATEATLSTNSNGVIARDSAVSGTAGQTRSFSISGTPGGAEAAWVEVIAASVGGSGVTPANPADMTDVTAQSFTASNGQNGNYHRYAANLPYDQELGLCVQLHGDGFAEYTSPTSDYSIGGTEGILRQARYRKMICVVARTPDEAGGTWWEAGTVCSVYLRDLINNLLTTYPNVTRSKIWLVGYSGGSEQIALYYLPGFSSSLTGGGSIMFGGGGVPDTTDLGATSSLKANFPLKWWVGDIDTGADDGGYDALNDSLAGKNYYASHGWTTFREVGSGNHSAADTRYGAIWGMFMQQVGFAPAVATGTATRATTTTIQWTGTVTNAPAVTLRCSATAFGTQTGIYEIGAVDYTTRTVTVTVTGLTAGTAYNWRLEIGGNDSQGTLLASGTGLI
jgi:hypothetical protein